MNLPRRVVFYGALLVVAGRFAVAAEKDPVYDSPAAARADADFGLQGEYVGDGVGVQVAALGGGDFSVVSYRGGLPGAGWDGKEQQTAEYDRDELKELVADWKKVERASPTLGAKPPAGSTVLFDGSPESLARHWRPGARRTADGLLLPGCTSVDTFGDFTLHLEFRLPYMPRSRGRSRGSSGCSLQELYTLHLLDSFGFEGNDPACGAISGSIPPAAAGACLPPLAWQSLDVDFTAARFDEQAHKTAGARLTARLNGTLIHQNVELVNTAKEPERPAAGALFLADLGDPVHYRNIWVLPRDLVREARRPIVPGFERFYGRAGGDGVAGGRLLLAELNCTACHQAEPALVAHLIKRQPPVLESVANRLQPEYALAFLTDPHGTKPGTPMPDVLAGLSDGERVAAARALVSFLLGAGRPREQAGNRQWAKHGEQLYQQIGCVACHEPQNGQTAGSSVPLGDLKAKYTIASLTDFLKNPWQARPSHRMPGFNLNPEEARDLACYLIGDASVRPRRPNMHFAAYEGAWNSVPDFGLLTPYKQGESAGLDLAVADRSNNFGVRFDGLLKIDRGGRYTFHIGSDDGSLLFIDGQRVADSDGIHPHQVRSGNVDLQPGTHAIRVDYMQGGGEWTLDLDVEGPGIPRQAADVLISLTDLPPPELQPSADANAPFVFDPSLVDKGRELFSSLGCAACHGNVGKEELRPMYAAKPLSGCDAVRGCLATTPTRPAADFSLTTIQRDALAAALKAAPPVAPPTAQERIVSAMTSFNCYACHARDGRVGPSADRNPLFATTIPEMGDEGRVPPPLDGVGDKLQAGWLRHVLQEGAKDRPYMLTRMPKFAAAEVAELADAFRVVDERTEAAAPQMAEPASRIKSTGRFLVGDKALACIKCHTFGGHRATGIQAINLQTMTGRIREDWFRRYLPEPAKYRPGTRMPSGFAGGQSTIKDIYHGDAGQQIAAIWAYLSEGSKAGIPDGLIADVIELKPETTPIIYRNFIDGLSPRGIAVGYPEKTNLAWDANNFCLTLVWHGRFIDASKHWEGRGAGFQTPLGDHIVKLEQTVPVASLDSLDAPWPTQPPKERGYHFRGYRLDAQGRPTFRYEAPSFAVEDFLLPIAGSDEGRFERHITVSSTGDTKPLYFLAGAGQISQVEGNDKSEYTIAGVATVRLRGGRAVPLVRHNGGRQELLVPLEFDNGQAHVVQEISW
ncbi:MAG TPA: c-type cytochrome [Pirellulales bacterium]|nr:c-type cytochrome [Pirellulales bacterium]